jgi:hypothetical protein
MVFLICISEAEYYGHNINSFHKLFINEIDAYRYLVKKLEEENKIIGRKMMETSPDKDWLTEFYNNIENNKDITKTEIEEFISEFKNEDYDNYYGWDYCVEELDIN